MATSPSFQKMATVTASTKRNPDMASGRIGSPIANLTSLKITPFIPADDSFSTRYALDASRKSWVTYIEEAKDIIKKDLLVVGSTEYIIVGVGAFGDVLIFDEIIVEESP